MPILIARNNPKPTVKTTKVQSTINAMEATGKKMRALDISTLSQEEEDLFRQVLETLETTAQEMLTTLQKKAPGNPA